MWNPIKQIAKARKPKGKKMCSFCELRVAKFSALKPVIDKRGAIVISADQAGICGECYVKQFREIYPGEKLPV